MLGLVKVRGHDGGALTGLGRRCMIARGFLTIMRLP